MVSLVLSLTLLWGGCAGAQTNALLLGNSCYISVSSHQEGCVISENTLTLSGTSNAESNIQIYVDGAYISEAECVQGKFSCTLSNLAEGRRCVTLQTESTDGGTFAESLFINIASEKHDFVGTLNAVQTFDSLPDWGDISSDSSRIEKLSSDFAFGIYPGTLSVLRTEGASGKNGDYALYVEKPPSLTDGTKASLKYNEGSGELMAESGTVTIDFDLKLNSSQSEFRFFSFPPWHSGHALVSGGKLAGTNAVFPENKWVHVNMLYDLTDSGGDYSKGKWYVTLSYDGVSIRAVDGADAVENIYHTGDHITLQPYGGMTTDSTKIGFALDNFSIVYNDENIYIKNITSIDKLNNEKPVYNSISEASEKLVLTLSREAEVADSDISLFIDNEELLPVSAVSAGKELTIELPRLYANKTLSVILKKDIGYVTDDIRLELPIAETGGYFTDLKYSDIKLMHKLITKH